MQQLKSLEEKGVVALQVMILKANNREEREDILKRVFEAD